MRPKKLHHLGCWMAFCNLLSGAMWTLTQNLHSGLQGGIAGTIYWPIDPLRCDTERRPRSPDLIHSDRKQIVKRHSVSGYTAYLRLISWNRRYPKLLSLLGFTRPVAIAMVFSAIRTDERVSVLFWFNSPAMKKTDGEIEECNDYQNNEGLFHGPPVSMF